MIEHVRKTLVLLCSIYKSPSLYGWVSSCWVGALGALDVHVSTPFPSESPTFIGTSCHCRAHFGGQPPAYSKLSPLSACATRI